MADDSLEVIDDFPFHPTDSPRGMHYYNMDILTDTQQKQMNRYKLKYIRNTERYLNDSPMIRALVALIYRVVLRSQPRRNLHLTIAEYFSKPRSEIEQDVNEYLQQRGPKTNEFPMMDKLVERDYVLSNSESEKDISTVHPGQTEKEVKLTDEVTDDAEFIRGLVEAHLDKQIDLKHGEFNKNIGELKPGLPKSIASPLREVTIQIKDRTKENGMRVSEMDIEEPADNIEEQRLITMTEQHAERHKALLKSTLTIQADTEKSRKWLVAQMCNAERQWRLLQVALQGNISPEVQDALRMWQIVLMERTEDMSPEMKEAQMDWLEGQTTQGNTMSRTMIEILRLWQSYIFMQGSVMSTSMMHNEINQLHEEITHTEDLPGETREDKLAKLEDQIKQMDRAIDMLIEMQDLERQWLQNQIDTMSLIGYLTPDILSLEIDLLELERKHRILTDDEYKAKLQVLSSQMDYGMCITYETLSAQKKWLEWQLAVDKITRNVYNIQRQFINYQLEIIRITSSQTLLSQMNWLQNQLQNYFISKEAFEDQKKVLHYRIGEQNKDTIPKIQEQMNWLERQYEFDNISDEEYNVQKIALQENIAKIISDNKTVDDLQFELETLQQEFTKGRIPDTEYQTKKKTLKERIFKLNKTASDIIGGTMQALEWQMKSGTLTMEEYNVKKAALQKERGTKESDTNSDNAQTGSDRSIMSAMIARDKQMKETAPVEQNILTTTSAENIAEDEKHLSTLELIDKNDVPPFSPYEEAIPHNDETMAEHVEQHPDDSAPAQTSANDITGDDPQIPEVVITLEPDLQSLENIFKPSSVMAHDLEPERNISTRHVTMPSQEHIRTGQGTLFSASIVEIRSADRKSSIRRLVPPTLNLNEEIVQVGAEDDDAPASLKDDEEHASVKEIPASAPDKQDEEMKE